MRCRGARRGVRCGAVRCAGALRCAAAGRAARALRCGALRWCAAVRCGVAVCCGVLRCFGACCICLVIVPSAHGGSWPLTVPEVSKDGLLVTT